MSFDPTSILNQSVDGEMSTQMVPVPEGEWEAVIENLEVNTFTDRRTSEERPCLDVIWDVQDPQVAQETGREKNTMRQRVFLDFDASGALSMAEGTNVMLGRLRDAVGQNVPGKPWQPQDLIGGRAIIRVFHNARDDGNGVNANVRGVSAIS